MKYEFTGLKITAAQTLTSSIFGTVSALLTISNLPVTNVTIAVADQEAIVEV